MQRVERLGDGEIGHGDGHLVAELDDLSAAGWAAVDEILAEGLEDGPATLEHLFLATGHDGERGVDRARLATTYRRVQHLDARFGETGGDVACDIGRDGGHVGMDEAGVRAFDDAVGAECDLLDVR